MKPVTALEDAMVRDIGHAFGYYDYGAEHGLIEAFPSRDAAAAMLPHVFVNLPFFNALACAWIAFGNLFMFCGLLAVVKRCHKGA